MGTWKWSCVLGNFSKNWDRNLQNNGLNNALHRSAEQNSIKYRDWLQQKPDIQIGFVRQLQTQQTKCMLLYLIIFIIKWIISWSSPPMPSIARIVWGAHSAFLCPQGSTQPLSGWNFGLFSWFPSPQPIETLLFPLCSFWRWATSLCSCWVLLRSFSAVEGSHCHFIIFSFKVS